MNQTSPEIRLSQCSVILPRPVGQASFQIC